MSSRRGGRASPVISTIRPQRKDVYGTVGALGEPINRIEWTARFVAFKITSSQTVRGGEGYELYSTIIPEVLLPRHPHFVFSKRFNHSLYSDVVPPQMIPRVDPPPFYALFYYILFPFILLLIRLEFE